MYKLISTNHSHNAQRLDPPLRWLKVRVPLLGAPITKHHIRDVVSIQVVDCTVGVTLHDILEGGLGLRVLRGAATTVAWVGLVAIAVDVHVGKTAAGAVDVECVGSIIAAVCEG
jgi:hypothetical protein